jgi:hypothetical protein
MIKPSNGLGILRASGFFSTLSGSGFLNEASCSAAGFSAIFSVPVATAGTPGVTAAGDSLFTTLTDADGVAISCAGAASRNRRAVAGTTGTPGLVTSGVFAGSATVTGTAGFATGSVIGLEAGVTFTCLDSGARAISLVSDGFSSVARGSVSSGFAIFTAAGNVIFSCGGTESLAFISRVGKACGSPAMTALSDCRGDGVLVPPAIAFSGCGSSGFAILGAGTIATFP